MSRLGQKATGPNKHHAPHAEQCRYWAAKGRYVNPGNDPYGVAELAYMELNAAAEYIEYLEAGDDCFQDLRDQIRNLIHQSNRWRRLVMLARAKKKRAR